MLTVKAGRPLCELVRLCHAADRPLLVYGHHGIGKSELLEQAAKELKVDYLCRDLSLLEPTDLTGLPQAQGGQTVYLPPAFLPREGRGLLVFEEINRCERYMRAPCLQLLTARCLNDYRLPEGWLPVAAANPAGEDYEVADLDPALASRFVQVRLEPDRAEWLRWARKAGVHRAVVRYVEGDETVFDAPESNPRAWKYVSDAVQAAQEKSTSRKTLAAVVCGLVGDIRGAAFLRSLKKTEPLLSADDVLEDYGPQGKNRRTVRRWIRESRLDLVDATLRSVLLKVQPKPDYEEVRSDASRWENLGRFLDDLPGDLREQAREAFVGRGRDVPAPADGQRAKAKVRKTSKAKGYCR